MIIMIIDRIQTSDPPEACCIMLFDVLYYVTIMTMTIKYSNTTNANTNTITSDNENNMI